MEWKDGSSVIEIEIPYLEMRRRQWQPTPVFLGRAGWAAVSGVAESDMTDVT